MAHTHDVYDMENHFEINGSSRFIKETSETKLVVVQGDHKSEVLTFKMPRYIDGHDMTLCNKIRIHYINLDTKTNNKSADVYEVTDLTLCEECEDVLTFTWTIEAPATKYSGTLSFLVKFECTEGENVLYQWNTAKYVSVNVLAGIDNSEEFVEKYSNVLEEWYNELTRGADSIEELNQQALAEIELEKEDAKEDIQGKANSTMYAMNKHSADTYNSFKNNVDGKMASMTQHASDTYTDFNYDVNKKAQRTLASIPEDYSMLDAEVKDIRVGVDGHTYSSAGMAVRGQIKNLSSEFEEKFSIIVFDKEINRENNLFKPSEFGTYKAFTIEGVETTAPYYRSELRSIYTLSDAEIKVGHYNNSSVSDSPLIIPPLVFFNIHGEIVGYYSPPIKKPVGLSVDAFTFEVSNIPNVAKYYCLQSNVSVGDPYYFYCKDYEIETLSDKVISIETFLNKELPNQTIKLYDLNFDRENNLYTGFEFGNDKAYLSTGTNEHNYMYYCSKMKSIKELNFCEVCVQYRNTENLMIPPIVFFDKDGNYLSYYCPEGYVLPERFIPFVFDSLNIPAEATHFSLQTINPTNEDFYVYGTNHIELKTDRAIKENFKSIEELKQTVNDNVFKGKIASFYGDSLTEINAHYTKGYHSWVADFLELASYNNYGVSGYTVENVCEKVEAINDTADIIFVMCGVNDQTFHKELGTFGDMTTDTTYGSYDVLCNKLKTKYPTKLIIFITPHYQTKYPHNSGVTSYEIANAMKEVAMKYAIPVYDNFQFSGIYSTNLSYMTTDNCHWNDKAHKMVGLNIANWVHVTFKYLYEEIED